MSSLAPVLEHPWIDKGLIVGPEGMASRAVTDALHRRGIRIADPFAPDAAIDGVLLDRIAETVARSRFVVAVFPAGEPRHNAVFELGLAVGAGKPLLILADEQAMLPSDVLGMVIARTRLDNTKAIDLHLDAFLAQLDSTQFEAGVPADGDADRDNRRSRYRPIPPQPPSIKTSRRRPTAIQPSPAAPDATAVTLQTVVASSFEELGAEYVERAELDADRHHDLTVWASEIAVGTGTPVLLVRTVADDGDAGIPQIVSNLAQCIDLSRLGMGLVVYRVGGGVKSDKAKAGSGPVVAMAEIEFLDLLRSGDLYTSLNRRFQRQMHERGVLAFLPPRPR